jgi:gliding motility-associated-like protein
MAQRTVHITATFSADPACTINIAQSYPASCACPADAGTSSAGVFGNGLNDYILCSGDTIIIVSDGNETNPNDVGVIGTSTYDPGITYGIYSCPPTPNTNPELDACFTGFITGTIGSFGDINDGGLITFLTGQGVTLTNNIIYYAPITLYNQTDFVYNVNCVDVGLPVAVQYLPQVVSSAPTENCAAGTFTVTINGGLPQLDGSSFTASNLLPATASFVNTTTTNGGTIQITGLQHGDNYSFDVADANGCPITITGGPFTGAPVADAGQADTSCTLTYTLNATLSHGTGAWTGPANISFSNATSPTATATSTTAGTYTLTWTGTSLPGCTDVSTVDITFLNPITTVVVPDCQDSSITVTISNGLPEQNGSNYTVSNLLPATANFTTSVATHAGDVVAQGLQNGDMYSFDITDDFGCTTSITGGPFVGLPIADAGQNDTSCTLTYNLNATPSIGTGLWTGPANISFSNATSPTATATSTVTGTYTLTWTETNTPGCTDAQSIDITFTQMSIPNVLTNISCNGGNDGQVVVAPQGGIVPYSYAWSTSANNTPVENNLVAGNITVTVTDGAGCTLDSTFTLTEPAAFNVTIANITQVTCNGGNNGQATANVSDVTTTYTYSWNTTPVQATATATGLTIGTYTVTATQSLSGCTDTAMVTITQPTAVTIATISPNITICSGQSTTITATATGGSNSGYTYTWDNGLGNGQNQTVTPAAGTTTTYQVTAVDANGCPSDMQDVTVTVHPNLSVIASVDDTICPGSSATISATPSFGNGGPYTYTWTPNTNISSTTAQSPTVTPTVTTTYTVTLSDGCSPTVTDQVTISLYNLPNPQATSDTLSLCIEPIQAITFYNTTDTTNGMLNPMAVVWDFGDGATAISPWDTITHTYTQPGTYAVSMTVSSMPSQGGCTVTQTVIPQINIYALPVADFTSDPNPTSMFEPEVQFADQSGSTIANWYWDFAGLDTSNYPNPMYAFPNDTLGNYPVTLTVTDIHGCQDEVTKNVIIKGEFGIYIPNAFTPDFDFKNDMFGPTGFGISPENYKFMIFDRWGEKLFDTDILFKPWDGFYKGTRVQEGVYVWKLFFKDINGKKHERIGHVTIIQ